LNIWKHNYFLYMVLFVSLFLAVLLTTMDYVDGALVKFILNTHLFIFSYLLFMIAGTLVLAVIQFGHQFRALNIIKRHGVDRIE
jgi:hypothetical protein